MILRSVELPEEVHLLESTLVPLVVEMPRSFGVMWQVMWLYLGDEIKQSNNHLSSNNSNHLGG